jgi:3-dehydroquinate dehydratase-1
MTQAIDKPRFCIPIIASGTEEAIKKMGIGAKVADVLEVRLDLMRSFDIIKIIKAAEKPVLITYRSVSEGGKGTDGPEKIAGHLITAIESGADLIDMELGLPAEARKKIAGLKGKSKIIVSTHITIETPPSAELERLLRASVAASADIIKIVTTAQHYGDNLRILDLVRKARQEGIEVIAFCMGPLGKMSRIFSVLMGAYMTFASLEPGQESAGGQIPIDKMKEITGFFST